MSKKFKANDPQSGATYNTRTGVLTLHDETTVHIIARSYLEACKRWDEMRTAHGEWAKQRAHWAADRAGYHAYLDECDRLSKLHKRQVNNVHEFNPGWVNPCPRPRPEQVAH